MIKALFQEQLNSEQIRCHLCVHRCILNPDNFGVCGVRKNIGGILYSYADELIGIVSLDPVEKKPLYHVHPFGKAFSFAGYGCNLHCEWCQNHKISQNAVNPGQSYTPEEIVSQAVFSGADLISATYTEPTIFFEFAHEVNQLARQSGITTSWVTNGTITPEALEEAKDYLDAVNVDLKGIDNPLLKKLTGVSPDVILENIKVMIDYGIHVEVTTLLIPGVNDSPSDIDLLIQNLLKIDNNIIWHISAYYPSWKFTAPPTRESSIIKAVETAKKAGLKFCYGGNISKNAATSSTICPQCNFTLIDRVNHTSRLTNGSCPNCNTKIPGIF
ncbi:MAG: AmmeMemoRadiSam system radical SAM enzyme [Deltaproteobacteria bacterium]|nr:AmmeMemoRadiSam system radical SAM enzyme [Deltaproteobacteria bacterium]